MQHYQKTAHGAPYGRFSNFYYQYFQDAFSQASKYFYFHSPKEKFSKKTPKNAKNLDKILRGGCAKSDEEKFGDFLKAFSKKGTAVESIEIAPSYSSIQK